MKRGSRANPVIVIACLAYGALPGGRCARGRYPSGRPGTFASEFGPGRAVAAVSAR
jgi:hypothetical protein